MRRSTIGVIAVLMSCLAAASCSATGASGGQSSRTTGSAGSTGGAGDSARVTGAVTVLAAASLKEAFTALGKQFHAEYPDAQAVFSFGPSSGLAQQVKGGSPADVFASASASTMGQVVKAGAAAKPTTFATNSMQIAVPPDNPAGIEKLGDLARAGVKVAVCQVQVPCGATAAKVFANAGLTLTPVTQEVDVKAVLAKVTLGEVDAGIVYGTDVRAAGSKVKGVEIPGAINASTSYPIAVLTAAPNAAGAKAFVELVLSASGQQELARDGFGRP